MKKYEKYLAPSFLLLFLIFISIWWYKQIPLKVRDRLENTDRFEFLTLDPTKKGRGKNYFHGRKILGKAIVKNRRKRLINTLYASIRRGKNQPPTSCFIPRHGIRTKRGKIKADFLICFQCSAMIIYSQKQEFSVELNGGKKEFNKVARELGLTIAK